MNTSLVLFLLICGTVVAIILVLFWHPKLSQTRTSTKADWERSSTVFRDDERYWYGGYFYNNPDDPALFVPKRFGLGWTLNFGHPRSKLFLIFVLLVLVLVLVLPLLVVGPTATGCHTFGCQP